MKKIRPEQKIKPEFNIFNELLEVKELESNDVIAQLEENMRLRELPVQEHIPQLAKRRRLSGD